MIEIYKEQFNQENPHYNDVMKSVINSTSGIMGKTENHKVKRLVSTCASEAWSWIMKHCQEDYFLKEAIVGDTTFYIYGVQYTSQKETHNLPQYLQILGEQLVKVYEGAKSMTGGDWSRLIHRNVDCITIKGKPSSFKYIGKNWGDFRDHKIPPHVVFQPIKNLKVDWTLR